MARVRGDKRANSPIVYVLLAITAFALWSLVAAAVTADACGTGNLDAPKDWRFFPPGWECVAN